MIGHLYRYPHPTEPNKFLYVGQGENRDRIHRKGYRGFGERFKKRFPGVELPQPIKETFEVENQIELNELETIWMFQYHTWRGYPGGMNLCFPGSTDYKSISKIGAAIAGRRNSESGHMAALGRIQGRKNVESGRLLRFSSKGGFTQGRRGVESGQFALIRTPESCAKGGRAAGRVNGPISGRKSAESGHCARIASLGGRKAVESGQLASARCLQWNIRRGKPCICGRHQVQSETHGA